MTDRKHFETNLMECGMLFSFVLTNEKKNSISAVSG